MSLNLASRIVDVSAPPPEVDAYWFLGVSGSVTATGFFIDPHGTRTGDSFSTTIDQGDGANDPVKLSASIPEDAVGAYVRFTGDVYFDLRTPADDFSADFKVSFSNYPKVVADPEYTVFGRA